MPLARSGPISDPSTVVARRSRRARVAGAMRAAAVLAATLGITLGVSARAATARMSEAALDVGARLMRDLDGARPQSGVRRLTVNGLTLHMVTASFDRDLSTVLDDFEARCARLGDPSRAGDHRATVGASTPWKVWSPTQRLEERTQGMVACLDTGGELGLAELTRRLLAFAESGDLGQVGALRSVVARRSGTKTQALIVWTEGSARLGDLFPPTGDSPGIDPEGFPRPDGARRLLFARLDGERYAFTLFAAPRQAVAVAGTTTAALRAAGWSLDRLDERDEGSLAWLARRGSAILVVRFAPNDGGGSAVTVMTLA